jgi:hypothetical protein
MESHLSANEQVRVEMEIFLQALDSYAESFARNPAITFEEHCASLMSFARVDSPATRVEHVH